MKGRKPMVPLALLPCSVFLTAEVYATKKSAKAFVRAVGYDKHDQP
jgi:hypothetical protein